MSFNDLTKKSAALDKAKAAEKPQSKPVDSKVPDTTPAKPQTKA